MSRLGEWPKAANWRSPARGLPDLARLAGAVLFCASGCACERRDPQAEHRWQMLSEEYARLRSLGAASAGTLPEAAHLRHDTSVEALRALTAENERLRALILVHERSKVLASNTARRGEIEQQVTAIRGLDFKQPVNYRVLSRAEIRQVISGKLSEVFSADEFRRMSAAFGTLGLLPEGYPLREKYIDLLSEQIAAFYDQHQHKLFMYEDASLEDSQNRVILAHELTHALQDQYFGLGRLPLEAKDNDDRAAAASALVEGEATLVMSEFMLKNLSLRAVKDSLSSGLTQNVKQLEKAPRYLREMLVFPYLRGQEFCAALLARGGYEAISAAYKHPPSSTAQILHPERYLSAPPQEPVAIRWAASTAGGQKAVADNTVGEMGVRILLADWLDSATAEQVSPGWRGDRYLAFDEGRALIWRTAWASKGAATSFFTAEQHLLEKRYHTAAAGVQDARIGEGKERYQLDGVRHLRLSHPSPLEVILTDAPTAEWSHALESLAASLPAGREPAKE